MSANVQAVKLTFSHWSQEDYVRLASFEQNSCHVSETNVLGNSLVHVTKQKFICTEQSNDEYLSVAISSLVVFSTFEIRVRRADTTISAVTTPVAMLVPVSSPIIVPASSVSVPISVSSPISVPVSVSPPVSENERSALHTKHSNCKIRPCVNWLPLLISLFASICTEVLTTSILLYTNLIYLSLCRSRSLCDGESCACSRCSDKNWLICCCIIILSYRQNKYA